MPGQTLSEVRELLDGAGLAPRHRFGQNFLIDLNLMRKLPVAAALAPADVVLEVGPGTGSLTEILLASGARVVACEIDTGLAALLRDRLTAQPNFSLVEGDALASKHEINPAILAALRAAPPGVGGAYKLIANLPYQIATPLMLELLLLDEPRLSPLVVTIQKEVGQRLCAAAREELYGPISVVAQTLAEVRIEATLPPSAFWPRPDVDSAIVTLIRRTRESLTVAPVSEFAAFVRVHFQQRRKTLRASSKNTPDAAAMPAACAALGFSENVRPEELSPSQWQALYRTCRPTQSAATPPLE